MTRIYGSIALVSESRGSAMRRALLLVVSSVVFAFSAVQSQASDKTIIAGTAKAVDGDTISFDGLKVGLWGIYAPEAKQACGKTKAGKLSAKALHDIADGKRVVCEMRDYDGQDKRPMAVCTRDGEDIASEIVATGWAWENSKLTKGAYSAQETKAKETQKGLHILSCDSPRKWKAQQKAAQKAALRKKEKKSKS